MEINETLLRQKNYGKEGSTRISISVEKELAIWLREQNLSPTAIFKEACKELGFNKVSTYVVAEKEE